jgi:hypothetical protein
MEIQIAALQLRAHQVCAEETQTVVFRATFLPLSPPAPLALALPAWISARNTTPLNLQLLLATIAAVPHQTLLLRFKGIWLPCSQGQDGRCLLTVRLSCHFSHIPTNGTIIHAYFFLQSLFCTADNYFTI